MVDNEDRKAFKIYDGETLIKDFTKIEFIDFVKSENNIKPFDDIFLSIESAIMLYMATGKKEYSLEIAPKFFPEDLEGKVIGDNLPDHETWQSPEYYTLVSIDENKVFYMDNTAVNHFAKSNLIDNIYRKYADNYSLDRSSEEKEDIKNFRNEFLLDSLNMEKIDFWKKHGIDKSFVSKVNIKEKLPLLIDLEKEVDKDTFPSGNFYKSWIRSGSIYRDVKKLKSLDLNNIDKKDLEEIDTHSIAFEILDSDTKEYLLSIKNDVEAPTIDECLQQIDEEEAAKQNVKSPSL